MTYQVLARKWRPRAFDQLIGQEHVSRALINGLDQDRLHHAFLFTGTRGVGKTTIARILAKCLNCETGVSSKPCGECASCVDVDEGRFVDMIEIDAASRTGVDDMRELLESVQYTPTRGRHKVYIIDEVHMLSTSSFNALLKTLEEPPPHVKFVFATTDPEKIPVTILSRCLRFSLRRLDPDQISGALKAICQEEGITAQEEALERIAMAADGSMRDGLSLLDQAIAYSGGSLEKDEVERMLGLVEHRYVAELVEALAEGDANRVLDSVQTIHALAGDAEAVLMDLAGVLHRICLVQAVPDFRDRDRADWASIESLASSISKESAQLFYQIAIKGAADLGLAPDPRTGLEMTLLRMLAFEPAKVGASSGGQATQAPPEKAGTSKPSAKSPRAAAQSLSGPQADQQWLSLMTELSLSGQVRELARNVHLQSADGENWSFVIPPSLKHLGSKQCVDRLGQAISERLGTAVQVSLQDCPDADLFTAAGISERGNRQKLSDAAQAIEDDPTVKALKDKLGATIVEDSIQPLQ